MAEKEQSMIEFDEILRGRTLRSPFDHVMTTATQSGRVRGFVLQDVDTNEIIHFMTIQGAIEVDVSTFEEVMRGGTDEDG